MAKQIEDRPAEFCLPSCPYMDLGIATDTVCADNKPYLIINTVSCSHEEACKMWYDQGQLSREENKVLTPDELYAMDGEWVWCIEKEQYCFIGLFESGDHKKEVLACHEHSDLYFGIEGLTFCRRKPRGDKAYVGKLSGIRNGGLFDEQR